MIITISHQKGGVGKSTLAYNIALELARKHNVEVIDLDVQQTVTAYNQIRAEMGQAPLPVHIFSTAEELEVFFDSMNDDTIVIIDSGGFDSSLNRFAILVSDFIITPVSSEFTEILGLQKYESILRELSEQTGTTIVTNVVLNKTNPNQKKFDEVNDFIRSSKHFLLMDSMMRRRVDFANSVAYGFSVRELDKKSESTKELKEFIKEIKEKVGLNGKKKD
ncbi:ParA family protein [Sulfuricurvum sp.]|uniref:ParA family protein n=1 Tax=Sulfuricurvum sp. TaxID=2025608 RepID=UPI00260E6CB3|nr:ParA family protein [Sulfuricurvum sp.]MDD2267692.1 ParA family protein [Sulfuricurvum sp.]MDD2949180.1 ParA family protein [Sulfuricurvum sp.]